MSRYDLDDAREVLVTVLQDLRVLVLRALQPKVTVTWASHGALRLTSPSVDAAGVGAAHSECAARPLLILAHVGAGAEAAEGQRRAAVARLRGGAGVCGGALGGGPSKAAEVRVGAGAASGSDADGAEALLPLRAPPAAPARVVCQSVLIVTKRHHDDHDDGSESASGPGRPGQPEHEQLRLLLKYSESVARRAGPGQAPPTPSRSPVTTGKRRLTGNGNVSATLASANLNLKLNNHDSNLKILVF